MPEPMTGVLRPDIELISGDPALLFDPVSDAYFKVSSVTLKVVSFLTESMTFSKFREELSKCGIDISQEQLLQIIAFLQQNNLLIPEYGVIGYKRKQQAVMKENTLFLRFSASYLFFRLPPLRPEHLFEKITPYVSWLASKRTLITLLIPALIGYLLLLRNFTLVQQTFWNSLSWAGLVKYFFTIILLKIIHESAHSVAAMHFHCRVRGIGLGFMVFYPRLYTDTTDSWRLPRLHRLLIDGAGIIAELLCGGIAALLWCYLPPGPWQSTMFYIFAVSTISTLLVNGNPCIRYDGYYILCDLVNIENLMSRSSEYIKRFWRWSCLQIGIRPSEEKGWFLLGFGILSSIYRIFLYTSIILVIYHKFTKAVAVLMMFMELYSILIYPFWRELQIIRQLSKKSEGKARRILLLVSLVVFSAILYIPLSWNIDLPGETAPVRRTLITVSEGGFLNSKLSKTARRVSAGSTIVSLHSPQLDFAIEQMQERIAYSRIQLRLQQLDEKQFAAGRVTEQKLQSDLRGLDELYRRKAELKIRAPEPGIFILSLPELSANAFLPRGFKIGEIVSKDLLIYSYSDDYHIGQLKCGDQADIYIPGELDSIPAVITEISPVAAPLKNSILLQIHGGPIPVVAEPHTVNEYCSEALLYRITLHLEKKDVILDSGRFVSVKILKKEQLYKKIVQFLLSAFRKEF